MYANLCLLGFPKHLFLAVARWKRFRSSPKPLCLFSKPVLKCLIMIDAGFTGHGTYFLNNWAHLPMMTAFANIWNSTSPVQRKITIFSRRKISGTIR